MRVSVIVAALSVLTITGTARAETLPIILNAPNSYIPGSAFTLELHAPLVPGLTSYSISLELEAGPNPPPLTVSVTPPPGLVGYPFSSTSNFDVGRSVSPLPSPIDFTISDSASSPGGVFTVPGNDFLALVTVTPATTLALPITLTVTSVSGTTASFPGEPSISFSAPSPVTIEPNLSAAAPVPTPSAWAMFAVGGVVLMAARKRFGRSG